MKKNVKVLIISLTTIVTLYYLWTLVIRPNFDTTIGLVFWNIIETIIALALLGSFRQSSKKKELKK